MTDPAELERRYRRLLALYPRAFRREHDRRSSGCSWLSPRTAVGDLDWQSPRI